MSEVISNKQTHARLGLHETKLKIERKLKGPGSIFNDRIALGSYQNPRVCCKLSDGIRQSKTLFQWALNGSFFACNDFKQI